MVTEIERLEVEKVIHDAIGWAMTKDIDQLFSIMAQDEDFLSFTPIQNPPSLGSKRSRSWASASG